MKTSKRFLVWLLSILMTAFPAACGSRTASTATSGSDAAQIANPFTRCRTLEEAVTISGVPISVPSALTDEFSDCTYRAMAGLIEITYTGSSGGDEICIRKGDGANDISGDYTRYAEVSNVPVGTKAVTFKGSEEKVSQAIWTEGSHTYSVSAAAAGTGITRTMMADIINSIDSADKSRNQTAEAADARADGGWSYNQGELPLDKNEEASAAFGIAVKGTGTGEYEPLALLGSQAAAGVNYCILCRTASVVRNPESAFVLVYVHADPDGNAAITKVTDLTESAAAQNEDPEISPDNGWSMNQGSVDVSDHADVRTAADQALEGLVGADYEAVAYIGSRIAAGTDFCILCRVTPVVPDAVAALSLVYVSADLDGNSELTGVTDLDLASLAG